MSSHCRNTNNEFSRIKGTESNTNYMKEFFWVFCNDKVIGVLLHRKDGKVSRYEIFSEFYKNSVDLLFMIFSYFLLSVATQA
jgi:hypothetical protein